MSQPIPTDVLAGLVTAIDGAAEERGWNNGHLLVRVEAGDGEEVALGLKEFDEHPTDLLFGFTAPDEWLALGVCSEGWAAPLDSGKRPSESKGRMRVRSTVLVSRGDGRVLSGLRYAGSEFERMPDGEGVGMVLDALRRAVGVPAPPPEVPFTRWVATLLFQLVIGDGGATREVGWAQLRPELERFEAIASEGSWEFMRKMAVKHPHVQPDLSPDVAEWMDEGMFSRWVIGGLPPYDELLAETKRACTPEAFRQIRRVLKQWGLRNFVPRAA